MKMFLRLLICLLTQSDWSIFYSIHIFKRRLVAFKVGFVGQSVCLKDKDNILIDNIFGILLEDILRQLTLQRIRIKDS